MNHYDVIVIGLGVMGGAAACHCAQRGARVLGLEANARGHKLGSSHGSTRAIREAYFESPDYVPLVQRSNALWRQLEQDTDRELLSTSGAVYIGPADNMLTQGIVSAATSHGLAFERLTRSQINKRFPGFRIPADWDVVFETGGGILQTQACQDAHLDVARERGADIRFETPASGWRRENGKIVVETADEVFTAGKLILTLGPWACEAFTGFGIPLSGRRVVMVNLEPEDPTLFNADNMSVYFWLTPIGVYAGFPHLEGDGIRIARHDVGDVCTPDSVNREVEAADIEQIVHFAEEYMHGAARSVREANVCMYTMSPDSHFVVDHHPAMADTVFATGFSGHGFKFAPVIGEILADLSLEGGTAHPIDFLTASRFRELDQASNG